MQTARFIKWLCFGAVALFVISCSKPNSQGKLIPKNAAMVIRVDGKALASKLSWEEIKQNPLMQEMNTDSSVPAALKSLLNNPDSAGIDTKADLLFYVVRDSMGGYISFAGTVKDEKTFKAFNQQITENGSESETDGVQFISKSPVCVGWDDTKFVYLFDMPEVGQMDELSRRMMRDSIDITPRTTRDNLTATRALFNLKESNSLAKNEHFTQLMKDGGDISFWVNSEELTRGVGSNPALAMVNIDKFYKGNVTAATMHFDDGKMKVKSITYAGEELVKLMKKYSGGKVNEEMIKKLPGKNAIGVMALNFNPEAIRELIKMTGLDGLINMGAEKIGFSMEDFIKANKGDIVIGLSDLVMKPDTTTFKFKDQEENFTVSQKPSFNFVFATAIGDKDAFNKLVNAGKNLGKTMGGDSSKLPLVFNSNGTYFAMSNNQASVDQYMGTTTTDHDYLSKINGEPMGGYINIHQLLLAFQSQATKDSSAKIIYDASLQMWDNVVWKGGNFSNGGLEQTYEVNLVDKSTNSLKQLNQYAAKLSALYKEQKRKQREEIMAFEDFESSGGVPPAGK